MLLDKNMALKCVQENLHKWRSEWNQPKSQRQQQDKSLLIINYQKDLFVKIANNQQENLVRIMRSDSVVIKSHLLLKNVQIGLDITLEIFLQELEIGNSSMIMFLDTESVKIQH